MHRRGFLQTLLGGAIAAQQLDLDNLLWTPGKKKIFIPPVTSLAFSRDAFVLPYDEMFRIGDVCQFGSEPILYVITAVHPVTLIEPAPEAVRPTIGFLNSFRHFKKGRIGNEVGFDWFASPE